MIFIADVSKDINLSGHDSFFLNMKHVMINRPHLNTLFCQLKEL